MNARKAAWRQQYVAEKQAYLRKLKEDSPCSDCRVHYPYWVMEFDHRPGEGKLCEPSRLVRRSWPTLLAELAKCDLVCANCHRHRTYTRTVVAIHGKIPEYRLANRPVRLVDKRKGEHNNNIKISDEAVRFLRSQYTGEPGQVKRFADEHGVRYETMRRILRGDTRRSAA